MMNVPDSPGWPEYFADGPNADLDSGLVAPARVSCELKLPVAYSMLCLNASRSDRTMFFRGRPQAMLAVTQARQEAP